ncbi:PP2C family serine/threonine-protein phosphatase [Subdoligranulum variabile]|nr:PP2C family serine/threonine-protein phosphatase [Subdoligranulum variabile]UWP69556.1 protein phosphatase 2C domain-containing protein [Subdoligranulum variabile]
MWHFLQCAVQGRGHRQSELPCQDKTFCLYANGVYVSALADGAGSARLSHEGAQAVCELLCRDMTENFAAYVSQKDGVAVKQKILGCVRDCLHQLSGRLSCKMEDLASTLLVAAVNEEHFILAHIGDGVIGYLKDDELHVASHPDNGEFANTTVFTTSPSALSSMRLFKGKVASIDGIVLMSDGTEMSLYDKAHRTLAPILKRIMQMSIYLPADKLHELLLRSFEELITQNTTDDCSIAILTNDRDCFHGFCSLPTTRQKEILCLSSRASTVRLHRYCEILQLLQDKHTLRQVSLHIHLKPRHTLRHLRRLLSLHLIERQGAYYKSILILKDT